MRETLCRRHPRIAVAAQTNKQLSPEGDASSHHQTPMARKARARFQSWEAYPAHSGLTIWYSSVGLLLRPGECTTAPDPSREYDETRGCRPQNVTGLFTETPSLALCEEQVHHDANGYDDHEPTKLAVRQRRADMAHSDGLC